MPQTSRYGLPFLQAGQAQKELTHNDALVRIDALIQLAVESRHDNPVTAVAGASWIVPANPTGVWAGHDGEIAALDDAGWDFLAPLDGCIAFVRDEGVFIHFAGGQWRDAWTVPALTAGGLSIQGGPPAAVADPSGGNVIDVEGRMALGQLLTALRTAGLLAPA